MNGRTIKIFLIEGDPRGLRTVEVRLSTIKALISPRAALDRLRVREEAHRTGVYLLLGDDASALGGFALYVGEGDSTIERIIKHHDEKDFWHTVAIFTSKDDNLNKAHARFLEARLIEMADTANQAKVINDQRPDGGRLSESDVAEMQEVISQIRMALGAVGFDVFAPQGTIAATPAGPENSPSTSSLSPIFHLSGNGFDARMQSTSRGYVVLKDSLARLDETPSLQLTYRQLRQNLRTNGVFVEENGGLRFTSDYEFNSPSAASSVVAGGSNYGGASWKLPNGELFKNWEAAQTSSQ